MAFGHSPLKSFSFLSPSLLLLHYYYYHISPLGSRSSLLFSSSPFLLDPNQKKLIMSAAPAPAPGATPAAAAQKPAAPQMSGVQLYGRFAFAGAVCCSITHGALTPVDV